MRVRGLSSISSEALSFAMHSSQFPSLEAWSASFARATASGLVAPCARAACGDRSTAKSKTRTGSARAANLTFGSAGVAARALRQKLLDQIFGVSAQLAEQNAHARRIVLDAHDLSDAFDGLDVFHDDGEPKIDPRADG